MSDQAPKATQTDLKSIFVDVSQGHTLLKSDILADGYGYIKHLTMFDNVETDMIYAECLKIAKEKGLPTNEEQEEYLKEEQLWTEERQMEIDSQKQFIKTASATKSKLYLKSQIEPLAKQIEEAQIKITILENELDDLIGFTAEKYATKRANEIYIQKALYRDKEFQELSISEELFDETSDSVLSTLTKHYNEATKFLNIDNLKRVAISSFFCNYYYLCDDNPQVFYGRPVVDLTFFQSELFAYARYFKGMAQNSKATPPDDIRDNPDKMIEFYEMRGNAEEVMDKIEEKSGEKSGATTLVGATNEDLEALGYKKGGGKTIDLMDVAGKKGGQLSMDDFIDLHS